MNISDGEFALMRRNAQNVAQANATIDTLADDNELLRQKLADAYARLGLEMAHSAALEAQLETVADAIPLGIGIRTLTGRFWADGRPLTQLAARYVEVFDERAFKLKLGDPTKLRDKLAGE